MNQLQVFQSNEFGQMRTMKIENEIKEITQEEVTKLLNSGFGSTRNDYEPRGLFYKSEIFYGKKIYVGIDNSEGCAWTEEFDTLEDCKAWLKGETQI